MSKSTIKTAEDVIDKTKQNLLQLNMLKNMKALMKPH